MYGYANNRLLAGAEYVAKANLQDANGEFYTLPFSPCANRQGYFTAVSTSGRPNYRPAWEAIYNHYVNRKGLSAPFVTAYAAQLRAERAEWGGDQPSFGTLIGGASWGEGRNGGRALLLDGQSGHLALPAGVVSDLGAFTVSLWVYWNASAVNARVFDFGSSDIGYMALMPRDSQRVMRFMVTGTTYFGEQNVSASSALTAEQVAALAAG